MNTLSWFIYWADVIPSFAQGFSILSIFSFIISVFINAYQLIGNSCKKYMWISFLCAFMLLLSSFMPSKNTLYAIAASEMGEDVYKSEQGQKIVKQLSDWVEAQLKVNK